MKDMHVSLSSLALQRMEVQRQPTISKRLVSPTLMRIMMNMLRVWPLRRSKGKNYNLTQKFQLEWACKLPWVEGILTNNGRLHMVKCTMCLTMERTKRLMQPKWDTLKTHEGRRKATRNIPAYNVKKINGVWLRTQSTRKMWFCSMQGLLILCCKN